MNALYLAQKRKKEELVMYAIEFDANLYNMRDSFTPRFALDEKGEKMLLDIFKKTDAIKASGDDDMKEFWIRIPCGTYEEFVERYDPEDTMDCCEEDFLSEYSDKEKWYPVVMRHYVDANRKIDMYSVFIDREYIFSVGDQNMKNAFRIDASELLEEFDRAVSNAIEEMKADIYNEKIKNELPYKRRYGKIPRKDYWNLQPELREEYRKRFSERDWEEFCQMDINEMGSPGYYLETITARQYFEACAIGYKAAGIKMRRVPGKNSLCKRDPEEEIKRYDGYTPREWYKAIAEGRDDGLAEVPLDDPEALAQWLRQEGPYYRFNGHHPWEVVPSGSVGTSLHFGISRNVHLSFCDDEKKDKYYFWISGRVFWRSHETIAFYLAVKRAGYPVVLHDAKILQARLLETDCIGITPYNDFFGGPVSKIGYDVLDLISLNEEEKKEEVIKAAEWIPETEAEMKP